MAKTKKIEKDFLLSDSSVNCYGFRLLTSGYLIDEYKKNPIGYHMHDREDGVVVKWEDLRVDGDKVLGKPVINLSNERGQQTVDEVENGFLNGASVGHIVALEWSEDPQQMLPGQTGPTITKWYNRECSLCDVPGNFNALALFDKEGKMINLADFKINNSTIQNMKQIFLTADQLAKLNLKADSEPATIDSTINDLVTKAAKVDQLTQDLAAANTAKKTAEDALAAEKAANVTANVTAQLDAAVDKKMITVEKRNLLAVKYKDDPDGLKALLALEKPYTSVTDSLSAEEGDAAANAAELKELSAKKGEDLFKEGKLDRLKALSPSVYKVKYKEAFGADAPAEEAK